MAERKAFLSAHLHAGVQLSVFVVSVRSDRPRFYRCITSPAALETGWSTHLSVCVPLVPGFFYLLVLPHHRYPPPVCEARSVGCNANGRREAIAPRRGEDVV